MPQEKFEMIEEEFATMDLPQYLGEGWELFDIKTNGYDCDIRRVTFVWKKKSES